MELRLSPERERFVRQAVESGRYASASEVVEAALGILMAQDATGPTQRAVTIGLEQAVAGRSTPLTVDEIVRRALRKGRRR